MIAVLSRVTSASVTVGGTVVGSLHDPGLLVLLGVHEDDGLDQVARMVRKVAELRVLRGEESASGTGCGVLVVSQFTLCGDTSKGRRPSWSAAARPAVAEPLVDAVVAGLRERGVPVATGVFGADMAVASVNDGPFTVVVHA